MAIDLIINIIINDALNCLIIGFSMNICPISSSLENVEDFSKAITPQDSPRIQKVAEKHFEEKKNIQERDEYASRMPMVMSMVERLPISLKNSLEKYLTVQKIRLEIENGTQPKIASPQKKLMEKILKKYQNKYKIQIELCDEKDIQQRLKSLQSSGNEELLGIIVYRRSGADSGHVTPLICHFMPEENSEIVLLDVAPVFEIEPYSVVLQTCLEMKKVRTYTSAAISQIDAFSCRTDAMCVLRNALLHIRLKKEQNDFKMIADLLHVIVKPKKGELGYIKIPPEWDYTAQISNKQENANEKLVVRDCFSKKTDRSIHPRTIEQFRAKHKTQSLFFYTTNFQKLELLDNFQAFTTTELPEGITTSLNGNRLFIKWSEKSNVNNYMVSKGYKNL
jgi:hypothetical protein